jgi:hypothetical protein
MSLELAICERVSLEILDVANRLKAKDSEQVSSRSICRKPTSTLHRTKSEGNLQSWLFSTLRGLYPTFVLTTTIGRAYMPYTMSVRAPFSLDS